MAVGVYISFSLENAFIKHWRQEISVEDTRLWKTKGDRYSFDGLGF
jgi:hypothetical protein